MIVTEARQATKRYSDAHLRRWLLTAATCVLVFGAVHHVDHVIRGNHVGWPVIPEVTPFTFSLLIYPFLVVGLYLTAAGRVWAGYWLAGAIPILLLVLFVHFVPLPGYESLADVYQPYADPLRYQATSAPPHRLHFFRDVYPAYASPVWGVLAVADLFGTVAAVVGLIITAVRVRRLSGRW
jgi:hypothetical protein